MTGNKLELFLFSAHKVSEGTWKFSAIGEGTNDTGLNDMKKNLERRAYGV